MGQPAARVGDQTAHGGVITGPGVPTVLIGGMPACVMGDMHACPMVNPSPGGPPHVGAAVIATGMMVLIGNKPAARVGDTAICTGPPDTIVMGCNTVLIGEGGGGGGGMAGSGSAGQAAAAGPGKVEGHYLDVKFQDKGGKLIAGVGYTITGPGNMKSDGVLTGQIKIGGLQQGTYEIALRAITKAAWSVKGARVGDKVKLQVETAGIADGEKAELEIFIRDANFADHSLVKLESKVDGGKVEVEWELKVDGKFMEDQEDKQKRGGYSSPSFYYIVRTGGLASKSAILEYRDYIELRYKDAQGNPLANKKYRVILSNGAIREGTLDGSGYAKVDNIPPGAVKVWLDPRQS
ncbi:MAG: hypothetical protein GYA46_07850 [candidate division Zixibacteria bacterium]|nr:hypothetical protein [candidate division Zixibacteria bacterium]